MSNLSRGQVWAIVGAVAVLLGGIGVLVLVFVFAFPSPGPPVASIAAVPNTAFTLSYASDGRPLRAFLDYEWDSTQGTGSLPIRGRIEITAGDLRADAHSIDTTSGVWTVGTSEIGAQTTGTGYHLFDLPAHPAGTTVQLSGIFDAPTACQMRVYVAP